MKSRFLGALLPLVLLSCLTTPLLAQVAVAPSEEVQQVDTSEINRRILMGLSVQHLGGIQNTEQDAIAAVAAPPPSDAHKWFISVVTMPGCQPCEQLKRDWKAAANAVGGNDLRQFAIPDNPAASWAHFNIYDLNDPQQAHRQKNWAIKSYPAIIVQAPANGAYGPKGTIVCHLEGYNGDPKALAKKLGAWIGEYAKKNATPNYLPTGKLEAKVTKPAGHGAEEGSYPSPYSPPPAYPPAYQPAYPPTAYPAPNYVVQQPDLPPAAQPQPAPPAAPASPAGGTNLWVVLVGVLSMVFGATTVAVIGGIVALALKMIRGWRVANGQTPIMSQAQFDQLQNALQNAGQNPTASRTP